LIRRPTASRDGGTLHTYARRLGDVTIQAPAGGDAVKTVQGGLHHRLDRKCPACRVTGLDQHLVVIDRERRVEKNDAETLATPVTVENF
jgi:hypothetical protein